MPKDKMLTTSNLDHPYTANRRYAVLNTTQSRISIEKLDGKGLNIRFNVREPLILKHVFL